MVTMDVHSGKAFLDSLGTMGIVGTVVIGFLAGVIAKVLMPGKDPGGLILTTLLGIGGSSVASYLMHRFHWSFGRDPHGFLGAVAGAFLILMAYRLVFRRGK
jgi:uncharacterized membrane protein YeaQ/YmgE (transglycosylase-associated protein family)